MSLGFAGHHGEDGAEEEMRQLDEQVLTNDGNTKK